MMTMQLQENTRVIPARISASCLYSVVGLNQNFKELKFFEIKNLFSLKSDEVLFASILLPVTG